VFKPESEWNAQDRWVNHRWSNVTTDEELGGYLADTGANRTSVFSRASYPFSANRSKSESICSRRSNSSDQVQAANSSSVLRVVPDELIRWETLHTS
jgi:hypothetical protein